ncbi:putative bifunctional diguanylate cyclase/phosphodiesterase [Pengzhenrongella sicca]|uniref:EAL domain-containing protein n=1 Tax=Pengzhenrongella sicca TaxID=2819238 RepID=A0A8A4ZEU4_9MICO|nr:bifunctional diguanylate cyclase/phosphodiesterase [Pengzhenrongella sicca]QTE29529.1 EAL domain-containing protein [Pengzhenrongella sicca]
MNPRVYVALFDDNVDSMLLTSPDGSIFAANRAACRALARTEAEICALGRAGVADVTDTRWAEGIEARRRDGHFRGRVRMLRGDGSPLEVELSSAVFHEGGELSSYVSFHEVLDALDLARDVPELRAAASVVETLESVADAYIAVDADWNLSYVNRRAEQLLRVVRREILGTDFWQAFPGTRDTTLGQHFRAVMRTGEADSVEGYFEEVALHCEVRAFGLLGGGIGIYFVDTSARFAVEQERERLLAAERSARASAELAQIALADRATHDGLTGLLNRSGLLERVDRARAADARLTLTVLFVDLDRFKLVNDTLGHATGDELLAVFADRLRALAPAGAILARFGGDEFVVALASATTAEANTLAERIVDASREPVRLGASSLRVTASVGIARSSGAPDLGRLLREADAALYSAKEAGREAVAWFDDRLLAQAIDRVRLEQGLRAALAADKLSLAYQPSFDLTSGRARHVEALARWHHPTRGWIPPGRFIPVAEDCGLIGRIGEWAIARAAEQAAAWAHRPDLRVWVNVSPRQLAVPGLRDLLAAHLDRAGVAPDRFGIEVTESTIAEPGQFTRELRAVSDLGVAIAVDDFGTGFSSLARLVRMPVDVIKIDQSFAARLGTAAGDGMLASVVHLAHSIGAHVIAEGVETPEQLAILRSTDCDTATGYLLARPGPPQDVRWQLPAPSAQRAAGA